MDAELFLCLETNPLLRDYCLRERRYHVHEINSAREERGEYHLLFPNLRDHPEKFYQYMRMKKETFYYILEAIASKIEKQSNFRKCISPEERLMVTLRFLSTGIPFRSMAFSFRMGDCTIGKIVYETCEAIWNTFQGIHMPVPSMDDLHKISLEYERLWDFPNCVGSIDGKHVRIKCPSKSGSMFFNYKKFFSIHLQGIADANCKFVAVDIGEYGRRSDSGVFAQTNLYHRLEKKEFHMPPSRVLANTVTLPYVLIGDQGYPLKDYLLRPYPITNGEDREKETFNYRLSRARRCIECAFGILVSKWRCLKSELQVKPRHVDIIVKSTCLLHNIIIDRESTGTSEMAATNATMEEGNGSDQADSGRSSNRATRRAYEIRDAFKNYFVNGC